MEDGGVSIVKQEAQEPPSSIHPSTSGPPPLVDSGDDSSAVTSAAKRPKSSDLVDSSNKRPKLEVETTLICCTKYSDYGGDHHDGDGDDGVCQNGNPCRAVVLPEGFLDPLTPLERESLTSMVVVRSCRQFWKAGDYEPYYTHHDNSSYSAFAELLDNALDEVCNGATYVIVDVLINEKDGNKMLLVQDNGGGMNPDKMRQCMSLGYSAKSKIANTIGQYGNGFKTSTMRLGADVIVFSCCQVKDGRSSLLKFCIQSSPTKSIGMLSYTFLQSTGKEDIVVPMIDYEKKGQVWTKMLRSSANDWYKNFDTIIHWSPYSSEEQLLEQFDCIENQGTRIIIYNLWEDDMGQLELDFDTDPKDIQICGVNRDEKKIAMARKYPNSKHFLTYQHSLRVVFSSALYIFALQSYTSILYLRLPPGFRIILRGKDVEHHNLVDDMMHKKETSYKPKLIVEGMKDQDASPENFHALVTLGFVKDAQDHIDIQGFNVYHKNRLIKPFWRVWNAAGSDGRGVIGVLEANFVEPAHDKQGFERTTVLSRLEARLVQMQKDYWRDHCHEVGYAPRRPVNRAGPLTFISPVPIKSKAAKGTTANKLYESPTEIPMRKAARTDCSGEDEMMIGYNFESSIPTQQINRNSGVKAERISGDLHTELNADTVLDLRKENLDLKKRLQDATGSKNNLKRDLQFERDRSKSLEVQEANKKIAEMDKEQEALIQIFAEERERRESEEENLRKHLEVSHLVEHL
ncbi:hypothetical protein Cgig2_027042 [Carnegiea gigantea]|uniref:Morc S5 domain-containing protein n=1 Tax=Carnegiea gigantea TaxID=171969 RepID=A0A9Q1KA49_9CARY|nr:hypothetical protein Cgig2_027042 [Carnegiea gigantea]